jgi:hypothetical protein
VAKADPRWALQRPRRPELPAVQGAAWCRTPIDHFVLARLEKAGIQPAAEADRITLVRRLSLDLIGLPPALAELHAAVNDPSPEWYEKVVERLLESPHYGERWGRHWLDLARYADSQGYTFDHARPTIWKYRDWVINALNQDMPFDRFAIEQVAGDLLPNPTLEQQIATGFHRNTLTNEEGGVDKEQFRVEAVIDRTNTTATVFLGLTLGCAQCHNHKYDPISQREYYQFFAFFNNSEEAIWPVQDDKGQKLDALVLMERKTLRPTHIHIKGDFTRLGVQVFPDVPQSLPPLNTAGTKPAQVNRLHLARWLVDPSNPLTARVTVNRAWQQYFGTGLVETENDFGTQGTPPSHPELLDWLATEFMARDWSMKALHRLIVRSATYRQSSKARPELDAVDPRNRLLARQSRLRLEAEIVRDLALASSGLLSPRIGGPSVFPPQPAGVGLLNSTQHGWSTSKGEDRYRRGMYTFFQRSTPHPALVLFDAPEATATCTRRGRSNTPLQALTLFNDQGFVELARGLAARILQEAPANGRERIRHAFRLCLARLPSDREQRSLARLLAQELADFQKAPQDAAVIAAVKPEAAVDVKQMAAWTALARVLLNLDEFITRE